ncbi:MAG: hypothetical protein N2043_01395 [Ignavibacterium sp.]|nr:hypothetical protein [Ignavibacterium sp.]
MKHVNLSVKFQDLNSDIFKIGSVIETQSGRYEYIGREHSTAMAYFVTEQEKRITVPEFKFANMLWSALKDKKKYNTEIFKRINVSVNGKDYNLFSLRDNYGDYAKENQIIHSVLSQIYMKLRFNTAPLLEWDKITNPKSTCKGCIGLVYYSPEEESGYTSRDDASSFKYPYYCGYTGECPSQKIEDIQKEALRGDGREISFNSLLEGCQHYVSYKDLNNCEVPYKTVLNNDYVLIVVASKYKFIINKQ